MTTVPKSTRYTFEKDGKKLVYTLKVKQELDGRYIYKDTPAVMRWLLKGTKPRYGRYLAEGEFVLTEDGQTVSESGELIYEFAYVGENYKKYMEKQ